MLRKDFKPSRLAVAIGVVKNFIQRKFEIDAKDRISLISYGDTTKKLSPFTYDEEKLLKSINQLNITGKGLIHEAISFALQLLVEEMRKIGGKIPRIFIISDDRLKTDLNRLQKILNIAKGLGVFIDTCQLGKTEDFRQSTLKKIAQITGGEYGYFNNSKAIINAGISFASKKNVKETNDYFGPSKKDQEAPLISEVALTLRRPTVMEMRMMVGGGGKGQEKCQICHSIKAPITNNDFYAEGRYCPSCDRPMHLSCAGMWAKKSEHKDNIFRCPFCFFLLSLPPAVAKLIEDADIGAIQKIRILEEDDIKTTKMIEIPEDQIENINASCSFCRSVFLGDTKVFRCESCGAFYHEPCLQKTMQELKACRVCGSQITQS